MAMPTEQIRLLREFTQLCETNPDILHIPELQFYRDWLKGLGCTIPIKKEPEPEQEPQPPKPEPTPEPKAPEPKAPEPEPKPEEEEEEMESDIELDESGLMEDNDHEPPEYAEENTEVTEDMIDTANDKRNDAIDAANEGRVDAPPEAQRPLPQVRKSYTIGEKIATVMWYRCNGRNLSEAQRQFGISRKSLRTWDKEYDRLLEHSANNKMMMKKIGAGAEPLSHRLDQEMYQWFLYVKNAGISPSNCMLMEQARIIAKNLNIDKFQGSYGWLRRWKMRFKIDICDHRRKTNRDDTSLHDGYDFEHASVDYSKFQPLASVDYSKFRPLGESEGPVFPGMCNSSDVYGSSSETNRVQSDVSSQFQAHTSGCIKSNEPDIDSSNDNNSMDCSESNDPASSAGREPDTGLSDDVIKEISVRKDTGFSIVESEQSPRSETNLSDNGEASPVKREQSSESPQFRVNLNTNLMDKVP